MKHKFNFLSSVILLVLTISLLGNIEASIYDFRQGFKQGYNNLRKSSTITKEEDFDYYNYIRVQSTKYPHTEFTTKNSLNGTDVLIYPEYITIKTQAHNENLFIEISIIFSILCYTIATFIALIYFVKFIISVNRNRVFEEINIHYLKFIGVAFIIAGLTELILHILFYYQSKLAFQIEGYKSIVDFGNSYLNAIIGICALLVAQFLKMGKEMKEEQELII